MDHEDRKLEVSAEAREAATLLVASLQDAFNAHDPDAISEHFAEEAAWATVMGKELAGRQEIAEFGRSVMDAMADSYVRYDVTRIVAVAPDVVAVRVLQTPTTRDGALPTAQRGAGLYVIARRGDAWKICAGQITFVGNP